MVAYHNRGLAYAAKDELDGAVADYTKAIELNPNYGPAFEDRGRVYARKGDYTRAIADVTRASELAPKGMSQEKVLAQTSRKTQPPLKSPPTAKSVTLQTSEAGTVLPGTTLIETVPGGSYPGWALHGLGRY